MRCRFWSRITGPRSVSALHVQVDHSRVSRDTIPRVPIGVSCMGGFLAPKEIRFRSLLLTGALPRERLASPPGRQTGVAELFFEIVQGPPRQA
jgi:hypothetical protein